MIVKNIKILILLVIVSALFITSCELTETKEGIREGQGSGFERVLTEEQIQASIEACSDLIELDDCVLLTPRGEMSGTCVLVEEQLRCVNAPKNKLNE